MVELRGSVREEAATFWADLQRSHGWMVHLQPKKCRVEGWYSVPVPRYMSDAVLETLRSMAEHVENAYEDIPCAIKKEV